MIDVDVVGEVRIFPLVGLVVAVVALVRGVAILAAVAFHLPIVRVTAEVVATRVRRCIPSAAKTSCIVFALVRSASAPP